MPPPNILPPSPRKVRINPTTGKMETVSDHHTPTPEDLERMRREVKDRIAGNEQFHDDPYKAPLEEKDEQTDAYDNFLYGGCFYGNEIWNDDWRRDNGVPTIWNDELLLQKAESHDHVADALTYMVGSRSGVTTATGARLNMDLTVRDVFSVWREQLAKAIRLAIDEQVMKS